MNIIVAGEGVLPRDMDCMAWRARGAPTAPRRSPACRGAHGSRSPACCMAVWLPWRGDHGSPSPGAPVAVCVCKAATAQGGRGVCCSRCAARLPAHSRAGAYGVVLIRAHALPAWHSLPGVLFRLTAVTARACGAHALPALPRLQDACAYGVSLIRARVLMSPRVTHFPALTHARACGVALPGACSPGVLHDMACAVWLPALPWCLCVSAHGCNGSRRGGRGSCSPGVCLLTPGAPRHGLTCAILCRCGLLGAYQAIPRLGRHSRRS